MQVRVDINGERHERDVPGELTLASLLRDDLGLTGTKVACGEGTCGSCTVLVDGHAVLSCLTLVAAIDGAEVRTVESDGELLTRLRQAFTANDGFQCGFCTPGQLMSALALLETTPSPSREQIVDAMSGNLCRCGAYEGIVDAVTEAAG
ncbi:MAG TPA: (2Fe-2S)-binding protein [Gaiellales bacterium]|nr:(2Fe-2S)-binding protein [Gaiellales bacterium]